MQKLSTKLTLMMLIICVVGMGLLTTVGTLLFRSSLLEESFERVSQNTAKEAARIGGWLESQTSYVSALSTDLSFLEDYENGDILPLLDAHVNKSPQYFDIYMGLPTGVGIFLNDYIPDYAGGWASVKRPWYIGAAETAGTPFITEPYTDADTKGLCITVSMTVDKNGKTVGVAAADILIDKLNDIVLQTSVGNKSYAFLVDAQGGILIHSNPAYGPDENDVFQLLSRIENGLYAGVWNGTSQDGTVVKAKGVDGVTRYYVAQTIEQTGWRLYSAIPVSVVEAPIFRMLVTFVIIFVLVLLAAFALIYFAVRRVIVLPIAEITQAAGYLSEGRTDIRLTHAQHDEIGRLGDSFTHMADSIRKQVEVTKSIADGDLTIAVPIRSNQDVMGNALERLRQNLTDFIGSISAASDKVTSGSDQISANSQSLAQGSTEQAATIQDLVESIAQISEKINSNTEKTRMTSEVSNEIAQNAEKSTAQISHMIQAVEEINNASADISKVIKTIDDIAFQTNILALNAAVEAARAGQHGKGFAVVADEVRNLASKSAQAAQETAVLIENSIRKASEGSQIAEATSQSLQVIIEGITSTATLSEEISEATLEQANAIAQINVQIEQVSEVVAGNAAISEECAASAVELSTEAGRLSEQVMQFRVEEQEPNPLPAPSSARMFDGASMAINKY